MLFNKKRTPWIQSDALLKKYAHKKNISWKQIDLINKVKCFTENDNHKVWSGRKLLFWLAKRSTLGGNQIKFSRVEYHSKKCGSDPQTIKHDVLENLGWQMSGISRKQTPSMLVSIGGQYLHFHPFVANSTIHNICGYINAAGQNTHRVAAVSKWNFSFYWFKTVSRSFRS